MIPYLCGPGRNLHIVAIGLRANGSSARDVVNIAKLGVTACNATVTVLSDTTSAESKHGAFVRIQSKRGLLHELEQAITRVPATNSDLLICISGHGYETGSSRGAGYQLPNSRRSQYVRIGRDLVMDYELTAVVCKMHRISGLVVVLNDTCHSGTLLDLENVHVAGSQTVHRILPTRPLNRVLAIGVCSDRETTGEDIGDFGGWGGKLLSRFMDTMNSNASETPGHVKALNLLSFYKSCCRDFVHQRQQRTHPVLSFSNTLSHLSAIIKRF